MKQQINLFITPEKVRTPVSAQTSLLVVLGLTLLLVVVSVLETRELSSLQQEVATLKQQKSELESETKTLREQKRPKTESPQLRQTRDRLQQQLAAQRRFGDMLAQLAPPGGGIFSSLLAGLAEQALSGVWLTRIQATESGAQIALQGQAHNAALIPKYLKRLGQASAYQDAQFDQFELTEAKAGIEFKLRGNRPARGGA